MRFWIQTYSGIAFDLEKPTVDMVNPEDIATALSRLCRFTGHVDKHYSVAQHCLLVSMMLPPTLQFAGLLHDAAEAYVGDVAAPLKRLPEMKGYKDIEHRIESVIFQKYNVPYPMPPEIKDMDLRILMTEKQMLGKAPKDWELDVQPIAHLWITPLSAEEAKKQWLAAFERLRPKELI